MSDWNEYDEGESLNSLDMVEIIDNYDTESVEDIEVSSTMNSVELIDEGIESADESVADNKLDMVDSIMDSTEKIPVEFEYNYENVDSMVEKPEEESEITSAETTQNQILDIYDINDGEMVIPEDAIQEYPDMEEAKVYRADVTELWEAGNTAIENNLEAMRDDLRDKGMEDGPEMEALIANEKILLQNELSNNIQGDFSVSYDGPSWQKDFETKPPFEDMENIGNTFDEKVVDTISVMDDVKAPDVDFEDEGEIYEGSYESTLNSENEILHEDGTTDTIENIQDQIENETDSLEDTAQETYETTPNSEVMILQEDGTVDTLENIQNHVEASLDGLGETSSNIQENISVDMNQDDDLSASDELDESVEVENIEVSALDNMNDYMSSHNYGLEDYEVYSKDPEWQALNRELQVANGIDINQNEELTGFGEQTLERTYDDFEQSVLRSNPEFYETGSYYTQGVNSRGFEGTCGPTSQANAINKLLDSKDLTENKVLDIAVENNLCNLDGPAAGCGGTTTEQFMELYDKVNEQIGDKICTELYEYGNVLDANQVAERLDAGDVVNVAVDSSTLWGQTHGIADLLGVRRDVISDHWITVTGVNRGDSGDIRGFDIIDSGGGERYVSLDKYNDMCFGTGSRIVKDPTCIVVSKKV